MPALAPLLDIQELDLASDAARARSAEIPERASRLVLAAKRAETDARLAAAVAERLRIQAAEEKLGREVSEVAREIEVAEVERYSGKRMDRDAARRHDESQERLRERQASIETQELELLEALEEVERRIEEETSTREAQGLEIERAAERIRQVEAETHAELEGLAVRRNALVARLPTDLLAAYDRIRLQPRASGRGAARLADGRCGACQIKLPSLENTKMQALPEDALIQCPQCRRVLVR